MNNLSDSISIEFYGMMSLCKRYRQQMVADFSDGGTSLIKLNLSILLI